MARGLLRSRHSDDRGTALSVVGRRHGAIPVAGSHELLGSTDDTVYRGAGLPCPGSRGHSRLCGAAPAASRATGKFQVVSRLRAGSLPGADSRARGLLETLAVAA